MQHPSAGAVVPVNGEYSAIVEKLVLHGDLSALHPVERVQYYQATCRRLGLDPLTQPFKILNLSGKLTLYCDRSGAAQLNRLYRISHQITNREHVAGAYYAVTARASMAGRHTESIGAVSLIYPDQVWSKQKKRYVPHPKAGKPLVGDDLCNAMMKAETKSKRRSTLDLLGLGMLSEDEIETIPGAKSEPIPVADPVVDPDPVGGVAAVDRSIDEITDPGPVPPDRVVTAGGAGGSSTDENGGDRPAADGRITDAQIELIRKLARSRVWTDDERMKAARFIGQNPSVKGASTCIERMKAIIDERKPAVEEADRQHAEGAEDREARIAELRSQARAIRENAERCDDPQVHREEMARADSLYHQAHDLKGGGS